SLATVIPWKEYILHESIQAIQVDIGKDGRANSPLGSAAVRFTVCPSLQVSSLKHRADQFQEAIVVNTVSDDREQHLVVDAVEAFGDVSFDEPTCSIPLGYFVESMVAPKAGTEAKAQLAELRLVVEFQDEFDHLLDQLVRPAGNPQGTCPTTFLRDVNASDWFPDPIPRFEDPGDQADLVHAHPIDGFVVHAFRRGTVILPDLSVRLDEKVFTTDVSIYSFQTDTSSSSIRENLDQLMD